MTQSFETLMGVSATEKDRYLTLKETLEGWRHLFCNRRVLDFGASYGLSMCALLELGASKVIGVEPDWERVKQGREIFRELGISSKALLLHTPCTTGLPFADSSLDMVLANAVLEHIPQPRLPILQEMWRVVAPGGYLMINETPNKYLPIDFHTTNGLLLVPWMPSELARRYAIWRRRFSEQDNWETSGWRGAGYYEISRAIGVEYKLVPEILRFRHRILNVLGIPPSLFDPYPTLVFQKL